MAQPNPHPIPTQGLLTHAEKLHDLMPDTAFQLYRQAIGQFEFEADTAGIIRSKIGISDLYKNDGFYHSAFDELWDAQILAEAQQDTLALIKLNRGLGSLYSIYQKYDEAIHHFQTSLHLSKQLKEIDRHVLSRIYYSFAVTHRKAGAYDQALIYLDSCAMSKKAKKPIPGGAPYVTAEKGIIYLKTGQLDLAQTYLEMANDYFSQRGMKYQIFTHLFMGDFYFEKGNYPKANACYRQSLISQENSPSHGDSKVEILKKLADSYQFIGQRDSAYKYQGLAIAITDSLFNMRTAVNNQLFRIRDKHDELIRAKNDYINQQQLIIEREKILALWLKFILGMILFAGVVLIVILRMRRRLRIFQLEKDRIKTIAHHEQEKAQAIMEVKSRELTANTLQIIEKDRMIQELLAELKGKSSAQYSSMKQKVSRGNRAMWERFEKRFIEVDPKFYARLRDKHPALTSTEHRHCALIKLGFDSKEMASLLGISLNSVHISRHRIRKKIGLTREESLSGFIAGV
ncbi:tetratricopeptide repeat protein [Pontibacter sp. G13]|uniref:tetratricopeptide repeat protein n=1 Tax=Pontibacter sp. G13 TaxID=3074898 RepID=UPI00288A4AE1|nr:tetratricopeptide repeat protein [Pontibacter sp. G13]WNJ17874.1 tetratricopeptide repeat protein [Pontibacter sp. G13]